MLEISGQKIDSQYYIDKWTKWALEPTDTPAEKIQENFNWLYKQVGLKKTPVVVCDTLKDFENEINKLYKNASMWNSVMSSVGDSVRDSMAAFVGNSVGNSVRDSVWKTVRNPALDAVWSSVWDSVEASVWASVGASVEASVGNSVGISIRASIRASVGVSMWKTVLDVVFDAMRDCVGSSVKDLENDAWNAVMDSVRDALWNYNRAEDLAFADVLTEAKMLNKRKAKKLEKYVDALQDTTAQLLTDKICIVLRRPKVYKNEEGHVHRENGVAIEWAENDGFYVLNGVRLYKDKELYAKIVSEKMTFAEILEIENTEHRLLAMRYNPNAILSENPKLIHKSERGNELYVIENSKVNEFYDAPKVWLLGFIDPSKNPPNNKMYEEVDPEVAEKEMNADAVNAFHCGLTLQEYNNLVYES